MSEIRAQLPAHFSRAPQHEAGNAKVAAPLAGASWPLVIWLGAVLLGGGCARDWDIFELEGSSTGGQSGATSTGGATAGTPTTGNGGTGNDGTPQGGSAPQAGGGTGASEGGTTSGGSGGASSEQQARCQQQCGDGTCIDGICEVRCAAGQCSQSLNIATEDVRVRIVCEESACTGGIECTTSAGCEVVCSGHSSCQNWLTVPGGADVSCSGPNSCSGFTTCHGNHCSIQCSGADSCASIWISTGGEAVISCTGARSCRSVYCEGIDCSLACDASVEACPNGGCCTARECDFGTLLSCPQP